MNIETILQMQCELLDQQKELKNIELETMEHLRLLNQNISKLAKKFDSFEMTIAATNHSSLNASNNNSNNSNAAIIANSFNAGINENQIDSVSNGIKAAKTVFTKLNTTIGQNFKVNLINSVNKLVQLNFGF
jgi:hypothetical protein